MGRGSGNHELGEVIDGGMQGEIAEVDLDPSLVLDLNA
jgi:hypothetical protein